MTIQEVKPYELITDYVTRRQIPNVGAEANRQAVERVLVEVKGYAPQDISVEVPVSFEVDGKQYASALDLVVWANEKPLMVIKCAAGSLASREREVLAGARIGLESPVPLAVVSDGVEWTVLWTGSGKQRGRGLGAVPGPGEAEDVFSEFPTLPWNQDMIRRERLIFRSYDMDNVNLGRKI